MAFLVTFLLTFLVVLGALLFFWTRGSPVYRVEKENVVALLELVVSEQAQDNDWQVFMAHPIRHDQELTEIWNRCLEISEREYLGKKDRLFTRRGLQEFERLLAELKAD